ncbi:MAG: O-methyltransferase [Acidimicrobiales bacterium]
MAWTDAGANRDGSSIRRAWRTFADRVPQARPALRKTVSTVSKLTNPARMLKRSAVDTGFLQSTLAQRPVDASGDPVPWYTFPAVAYLSQLDFSGKRVFEYGSGNSTLFWQKRAKEVVSVERDPSWHAVLLDSMDPDVTTLLLASERDAYLDVINQVEGPWDVIVVDGHYRTACAELGVAKLAKGGILILDNADWFPEVAASLRAQGLLEVDFHGAGPINYYTWTTSLFFERSAEPTSIGPQPRSPAGALVSHTLDADWR